MDVLMAAVTFRETESKAVALGSENELPNSMYMVAKPLSVMTGGVVSTTLTVRDTETTLLPVSCTVYVMVCTLTYDVLRGRGVLVKFSVVAYESEYVTPGSCAVPYTVVASTVTDALPSNVIVGGVRSSTVTLRVRDGALLRLESWHEYTIEYLVPDATLALIVGGVRTTDEVSEP